MTTESVDTKSVDISTPLVDTSTPPKVDTDSSVIQRSKKYTYIRRCIVAAVKQFDHNSKPTAVDYLKNFFATIDSDLLVEAMASRRTDGDTMITYVIKYLPTRPDLLEIIKLYIATNACINQPDKKGNTPFMLMMQKGTNDKEFFDFITTKSKIKNSHFFECLQTGDKNFKSFDFLLKFMQENYFFINITEHVDDKSKIEKLVTENKEYKIRIDELNTELKLRKEVETEKIIKSEREQGSAIESEREKESAIESEREKESATESEREKESTIKSEREKESTIKSEREKAQFDVELKLRKEINQSFTEQVFKQKPQLLNAPQPTLENREQLRSSIIKRLQTDWALLNLKRNKLNLSDIILNISTDPTDEEISNRLITLYKNQIDFDRLVLVKSNDVLDGFIKL